MIPDEKRVRKHESRRAVPPSPETGSYSAVFFTHWAYHHSFLRRDWEKGTMVIFMTKSMMLMLKTMAFDILGLRYWAHYLLKPDRSNSLSCNKIQFRFWSIRQCPIPSHLISLQKNWQQLDKVFVRWETTRYWGLRKYFRLLTFLWGLFCSLAQLKQYLSRWHPVAWTEEVPCKATNVKKKPSVCWLTRRRGWPRLTL